MASTVPVLLLLLMSAVLITAAFGDNDCNSYFTSGGILKPSIDCGIAFCCGTCDNRYCCFDPFKRLSEDDQEDCFFDNKPVIVGVSIAVIVIIIVMFIVCCVCPCCCIYKMCRKPRPAMATTTTTVISTQYPQQPVIQGGQYQPMPAQVGYGGTPAYGGQPMPTGPYQGQPYAAGPPPLYQEAGGPGYPVPYSQAAYDGGQATYPIQPPVQPVQPGFVQPPPPTDYSSTQPAYNPAYVELPKTGY